MFPNRHSLEFYCMEIDLRAALLWLHTLSTLYNSSIFIFSFHFKWIVVFTQTSEVCATKFTAVKWVIVFIKLHRLELKNFSVN